MVTLEEIHQKAELLYPRAIRAWLAGDASLFPYRLRVSVQRDRDFNVARQAQVSLIEHSKASGRPSYSLQFREINSRSHGKQNFVSGILFDSLPDLVGFLGKGREFNKLAQAVKRLNSAFPELHTWQVANWRKLLTHAEELDELIEFATYVRKHPMPGCHVRELQVAISTKTIERCESLMAQWLDILLPPLAKNESGTSFAERFGFEVSKDHYRLRVLDEQLLQPYGLPCTELSLPVTMLAALPVQDCRVVIVENKVNLDKLPAMPRTLALGGLGYGIVRLFEIPWLATNPLYYWGDIDVEGLEILARVRRRFPHTQAALMDLNTLEACQKLVVQGNLKLPNRPVPPELTEDERGIFQRCLNDLLRLEQERVPREYVRAVLSSSSYA